MNKSFIRSELLFKKEGMEKIRQSNILVFGVGGVGGYVIEALIRSGVEHITIVDNDIVVESNINRQIIASIDTLGQYKVDVMKKRILTINPNMEVEARKCFYLPETEDQFDFKKYDYVVDCVDTVAAKLSIVIKAKENNVNVISALGAGNKMDPTLLEVSDISHTKVDPLAKVMRLELRKRGIDHLKVVYSQEPPIKIETDEKKEVPRIECADEDEEKTLLECLKSNYGRMPEETDEESKEKERIVYDGIVDFSVFLLHVLKIYVAEKGLKVELPQELDDKKLIECFDRASSKDAEFSKDFAMYLLKIRFLFDAYVIKREYKYTYEKPDSEWSLKKLRSYVSGRSRSADYMHSFDEKCYDRLIMIQACFRVAYTSPKTMHWLTKVLRYLFQQKNAIIDGENYVNQLENMARSIVKDLLDDDKTYLGVGTQNIVFHYLDYLLWKADWETGGSKYNNFVFEFRDSVEHFYPQNPSNGSFDKWDEMISIGGEEFREVDQFGNLALLTSGQNSRLSNQDPAYKVTKLKDAITKGSIKLRIMSEILDELTKSEGMEGACKKWKDSECKKHGNEMLQLLRNDCEARGKGIS